MPRNVYSEINLHMTWHALNNAPVLVEAIETQVHRYLRRYAIQTGGVFVHEVGGIEDHVHLAVTIPPTVLISDWIGKLKGASSHFINTEICNCKVLEWQTGYGVVSFGTKDMPWVVRYIKNQREHHARGTTEERLERIDQDDEKPVETG